MKVLLHHLNSIREIACDLNSTQIACQLVLASNELCNQGPHVVSMREILSGMPVQSVARLSSRR